VEREHRPALRAGEESYATCEHTRVEITRIGATTNRMSTAGGPKLT
jgi:hypothetical protein